ncbi:MAG: serine/threonine-protein kinase, partial [Phycisphaerales bacterium]|nr:serine/threonine-protein kinase [Phycisphaerales bacterium]
FDQLKNESERAENDRHDDLIGAVLGHFRLEQRIASGGMGTVYLASRADDEFQQRVAVKVVKRGMDSEEILRRFREEKQTLAQLDDPHIARLLDAGATADGRPYLIMEYVDGVPIDRYCDQRRLPINDRLRLFGLVCEGVHAAHKSLVIHRDIKPSNIFVTATGVPKLLDFGIAKVLTGGTDSPGTIESERRLTPEYASPEQVDGGPLTTASDVYSLGVVLYELLTGTRPYAFVLKSSEEVRRVVCRAVPPQPSEAITRRAGARRGLTPQPPATSAEATSAPADTGTGPLDYPHTHRVSSTRLRGQLRGDLDTIVMTALRKEPTRRYASAEQLGADIGRYLAGMPITARRDTWPYRTRKFVARHAVAVTGVTVAVALLIAGLIVQTHQKTQIQRQRDELAATNLRLDQTRRVLVSILSGAQSSDKGPGATLGEVLEDAAHGLLVTPPEDALTRAGVNEAVGKAMMTLGMTERARPLLEAALAEHQGLPPASAPRLAVETELAQLLYYEGKYAEAEPALRGLLARAREASGGAATSLEGDILNALGAVLRMRGSFEEAMSVQREALSVRTAVEGAQSLACAESLNNIASIHFSSGRYAEAVESFRLSLAIRTAKLRPGHPMLLATSTNLGLALLRAGDAQAAIPFLEASAAGWAGAFGPQHAGINVARTSLGQAYRAVGRFDESLSVLRQVQDWQAAGSAEFTPAQLATRANIGITLAKRAAKDGNCQEAIAALESVRSHALFGSLSRGMARQALSALAEACELCGRGADATRYRNEATGFAETR